MDGAKQRAALRGLAFSLDALELTKRVMAGRCEVSGLTFDLSRDARETYVRPFAPSLDRRVPELGYTMENVQVVAWVYNAAKGQGTHEDVLALARALLAASA